MRRLIITILIALLPVTVAAQEPIYTLEDWYGVRTNKQDSTYSQGLTHRYVDGELRFLTVTLQHTLQEFRLPAPGQVQTSTTATWDLSGIDGAFLAGFHGIWYEQAKNRLWITSATDYTATNIPARVTLVELGSSGSFRVLKQFFLDKPAKRVYGGCQAVPASLVEQLGGPYVCGWGGYTSQVMNGGNASIGPTMYAIPAPDTIAPGATVAARTILDASTSQRYRGVRQTLPTNYFDGGDARPNCGEPDCNRSRPTIPPRVGASWLSPNEDGLGWMVFGDSYYNTGFWIGTTFGAVASLGKGAVWYCESSLCFDDRQFELHLWNGSRLDGADRLTRPDRMAELLVPIDPSRTPAGGRQGNRTVSNLAGATYDSVSGRLYVIGWAMQDAYTARLYELRVNVDGGEPTTPEEPEEPSEPEQPEEPSEPTEPEEPAEPEQPTEPEEPAPSVTLDELAAALAEIRAMLVLPAPVECLITSTTTDTVTIRRSSCGLAPVERGGRVRVLP